MIKRFLPLLVLGCLFCAPVAARAVEWTHPGGMTSNASGGWTLSAPLGQTDDVWSLRLGDVTIPLHGEGGPWLFNYSGSLAYTSTGMVGAPQFNLDGGSRSTGDVGVHVTAWYVSGNMSAPGNEWCYWGYPATLRNTDGGSQPYAELAIANSSFHPSMKYVSGTSAQMVTNNSGTIMRQSVGGDAARRSFSQVFYQIQIRRKTEFYIVSFSRSGVNSDHMTVVRFPRTSQTWFPSSGFGLDPRWIRYRDLGSGWVVDSSMPSNIDAHGTIVGAYSRAFTTDPATVEKVLVWALTNPSAPVEIGVDGLVDPEDTWDVPDYLDPDQSVIPSGTVPEWVPEQVTILVDDLKSFLSRLTGRILWPLRMLEERFE